MKQAHQAQFPSNVSILKGTFGYFAAGVACTLAGYSLARETYLPGGGDLAQLSIFWLLLAAGLANHAALYEQRGIDEIHLPLLRVLAKEIPLFFIATAIAGSFLYHIWHKSSSTYDSRWYLPLLLASAPLGLLTLHRVLYWKEPRLFYFRYRSYLPALATCLPPYILGYYLVERERLLLGVGILFILLWCLSLRDSPVLFVVIQLLILLIGIVLVFLRFDAISVCIFGVFLALAMGVSEAWRVTIRVIKGIEYRPSGKYSVRERRIFLGATNIATALFLPLFLTTYLHPNTKPVYLFLITVTLVIGYLLWFIWGQKKSYDFWRLVVFGFGTSLPAVLALGAQMNGKVPLPERLPLDRLGSPITFMGLLSTPILYSIWSHINLAAKKQSAFLYYSLTHNAVALTGSTAALLACTGFLVAFGIDVGNSELSTEDRVSWLISIYMSISLVASLAGLFLGWLRKAKKRWARKATNRRREYSTARAPGASFGLLIDLLTSTRPLTSSIAGFGVTATLAFLPSVSLRTTTSAALAMTLITMAGFVINDLHDRAKDKLKPRQGPIARGQIPTHHAITFSVLLLACGVAATPMQGRSAAVLIVTLVAVVLYSFFAHWLPAFKGIYTALMCCAPLVYGVEIGDGNYTSAVYLTLALFVYGREVFLDIRDVDADSRFGLRTVPVLIGNAAARALAVGSMLLACIATMLLVRSTVGYIAAGSSFVALIAVLTWPRIDLFLRLRLTRLPMFLGGLALASTVRVG